MVYVDEWTTAFAATLAALLAALPAPAVAYVAIERRINFTLADLAPACPAYRHFARECLVAAPPGSPAGGGARFAARQVPTTAALAHAFAYERTPQLELWELALAPGAGAV